MEEIKRISVEGTTYALRDDSKLPQPENVMAGQLLQVAAVEDGMVTDLTGVKGLPVCTIEPDGSGEYHCWLWDMGSGFYFLPAGTNIHANNGDRELVSGTVLNDTAMIVSKSETYTAGIAFRANGTEMKITVYATSETYGGYYGEKTLTSLLAASDNANIWGNWVFKRSAKADYAMPAADDSSTIVPTTAWVQSAIRAALQGGS